MRKTKHWLMTMAALLCSITVSGHDFVVDGIYYNITSVEDLTVEVTYRGEYAEDYNEYSGEVIIPSSIVYNDIQYRVTSIKNSAFQFCPLTSVVIPESVVIIGNRAFWYCSNLSSVVVSSNIVKIGTDAFANTPWYNSIENGVVYIGKVLYDYKGTMPTNTEIVIREGTVCVSPSAFYDCANLSSIIFPETLTSIGKQAFAGCKGLSSITIPKNVAEIGHRAFDGCLGDLVVNCNIPTSSVQHYSYGAFYNSSFTKVTIGEGVEFIGDYAFYGCKDLASITMSANVTSIGLSAFYGCSSLASIILPNSVVSIGNGTFGNCTALTSINIPEGVMTIGGSTFYGCSSLTSITIPENVTSIEGSAFYGCNKITAITCKALTPPTVSNSYTFYNVDKSIPVYVPASSVETYQAAEYWSEFTNFIGFNEPEVSITLNQYGSATYCSEYALDFSEVEGLKAYAATGYNTNTGVVTLTRVMTSQPGMGLFLKGEPGEYAVPVLESTNDNSLNMLVGTLESTTVNGVSDDGLYYNYRYTIKEGDEAPLFYRIDDGYTLSAGKAYLQIPVAWMPAEAQAIGLRFDEGGTTDIEDVESTDNGQHTTGIFDLMGRKVNNPQKGGVYIVNGKKVVW